MMWLRAGQDGRSRAPIIRTAPRWKQELRKTTTSTRKINDKNYYEVLEECYTDKERSGVPELADTITPAERWAMMMMMPWSAAILQQCEEVPATAPRDVPTAKPTAAKGAAVISSTTSATKMERTMTRQVPGVHTAMKSPARPATTTQTTTAASERERFASWQRWGQSTKSNRNAAAADRDRIEASATDTAAMQTEATKAK